MGGLLHLIDLNQGSMARKVFMHKRHVGGLEAPRNSLELPAETSQSYCVGENVQYNYQATRDWSKTNCYSTEAPMKKLISEEMSKRPNGRHNAPSVVARLMGLDMLPLDTKPVPQLVEKKNEKPLVSCLKEEWTKKSSVVPFTLNSSRQIKFDSLHHNGDRDLDRWNGSMKLKKPKPREHPQEEELQKFKKEFQAWQAARFKECSNVVDLGSIPSPWIAQGNLNKEKMILYSNSKRLTASENPIEFKGHRVKSNPPERGGLQYHGYINELFPAEQKKSSSLRRRTSSRDLEWSPLMDPGQKPDTSAPTKIVVLRPGPDRIGNNEKSLASSSGTLEERDSIEGFLEEVKERLKCELQGKTFKRAMVGDGIETPYNEKPSDPKQLAQCIAKQVRENVTRDLGMNLLRSNSTRSYRSEIQFNGTGSPEFINRDTRRFLSERLKNVMKRETDSDIPMVVHRSSRSCSLNDERGRLEKSGDILNTGSRMSYWENVRDEPEMQSRSFRRGSDDDVMPHKELSPRNLIRSLSAPVSGTSFGKLLLEDRHILTGAHIRRKHEGIEKVMVSVKKRKKEKFNFKEKVSSFKYSFTLRGRLFGKKFQSVEESPSNERDLMKDIASGPTVMMNFGDRHENSTEVPPSPASVCSSIHEELWRPADHLSPTSTSDVPSLEDNTLPQVFKEINSDLNELRRQLNQLESDGFEETMIQDQPLEAETIEIEDQAEVYIRDLLVASGLYDGSSDKSISRWDPLAKPISNEVFEEVEESYRKTARGDERSTKDHSEKKVDHKVLLDLLNEALSTVLGPPVTMSRFRKKVMGSMLKPPRGRKLLDSVWKIIRAYVYLSTEKFYYSLDSMVARDLQSVPWSGLMEDDLNALGKEMEYQIIGGLIEEIAKDM